MFNKWQIYVLNPHFFNYKTSSLSILTFIQKPRFYYIEWNLSMHNLFKQFPLDW